MAVKKSPVDAQTLSFMRKLATFFIADYFNLRSGFLPSGKVIRLAR